MRDLHKQIKILQKAQETYGYPNQITVAIEELCELASVLTKYPRYNTHTEAMEDGNFRQKVVDECADVCVVLQHVYMIMGISSEEIEDRIEKKLARLERWMNNSDDFSHTMVDREVGGCETGRLSCDKPNTSVVPKSDTYPLKDCFNCNYSKLSISQEPCKSCGHSKKAEKWTPKEVIKDCHNCNSHRLSLRGVDCEDCVSFSNWSEVK